MKISIIIPVFNESKIIESKIVNTINCLSNIENYELIIVDDGSTDSTIEKIFKFSNSNKNIFCITSNRAGKWRALEIGIKNSNGEIIVFTDANTFLKDDSILLIKNCFRNTEISEVSALITNNIEYINKKDIGLPRLSLRNKIDKFYSKFGFHLGSFGALYAVRKTSIIQMDRQIQNDDFVISVLSLNHGKMIFNDKIIAYEEKIACLKGSFKNKFRDALGHIEAVRFILKNSKKSVIIFIVFNRVAIWLTPIIIFLLSIFIYSQFIIYKLLFLLLLLSLFYFRGMRIAIIKVFALYIGIIKSLFTGSKKKWTPQR